MTKWLSATAVAALLAAAPLAHAQELKIGVVNSDRILRDSQPARAAMQKLEAEFSKRDKELQEMGARLKSSAERFEKDGPVMSESDRVRRQRELAEMDREFQRKQREFREDFNQRRNEELQALLGTHKPHHPADRRAGEVRPHRPGGGLLQSSHRHDGTRAARAQQREVAFVMTRGGCRCLS